MGNFSSDFFIGFVVATFFWLLASQMYRMFQNYMRRIKAAHSKVPADVKADANRARFGLVLWFFVILIGLFVVWEVLNWGTAASLTGMVFG